MLSMWDARIGNCGMKGTEIDRSCYQCQRFEGPRDEEEWEEEGTEGMCPFLSIYTDAFDDACDEFLDYDY